MLQLPLRKIFCNGHSLDQGIRKVQACADSVGTAHSRKPLNDFHEIGLQCCHQKWSALCGRVIQFLALVLAANGGLTDMDVNVDLILGL